MNILMLTESFPPYSGGSGWSTFYLCRALKKRGHKIIVAKINGKEKAYEDILIIPVINKSEVKNIIKEHNIDLVHAQHRVSTIWAVGNGVPATSTIRDYWYMTFDGIAFNPVTEENYFKETYKTVRQVLSTHQNLIIRLSAFILAPFLQLRTKYSVNKLKKYKALICNSFHTLKVTKDLLPNMECAMIHNLIDVEHLASIKEHKFEQPTVVFAGKLMPSKGPQKLIEAARKVKTKAKYIFIGEGQLKVQIQKTAKEFNIDTEFFGYLPNNELLSIMKGADVLVIPSLWNEPLGRVHLEGIGVGAKIITRPTGGTPDIIQDNYNGLLYNTVDELVEKIDLLLTNKELASKISANALKTAREKFDEKVLTPKFEAFYKKLITF